MLFDRNYSIPYIPGSEVKGVTRAQAVLELYEKCSLNNVDMLKYIDNIIEGFDAINETGKGININAEEFAKRIGVGFNVDSQRLFKCFKDNFDKFKTYSEIFGTHERKGKVLFFDSLPLVNEGENRDFIVVDITNVHYKPYYENVANPGDWHDPVPIFFLAVEKGTRFIFAIASRKDNLVKEAADLLRKALQNLGIGAKTSAGYGYFEV